MSGAEIYFSNNYRDLCEEYGTGAGFQFEFSCGRCYDTWRSPFEPYNGARMASWVNKGVNAAWGFLGRTGTGVSSAAEGLAGAGFGSARDASFQRAISNAEGHFNRCPRCTHYVCNRCWNAGQGICLTCAPDTAAEAVAARQRGLNDMVTDRAYAAGQQAGTSFDTGTPRQLVCPQCRTETHGTPFCPGCGTRVAQPDSCTSCHNEVPQGAAFCPNCGTRR
ncbi:double zinc ribbon domain-containing protein [Actinacidiphila acidipaludis]|uniref:Zinc ribbon domain-containing protein n=1 Tax=Actinacidiphila acidipaludis TaxID=2873382 RepID=A0ABS7QI38_9ACTN|nr:zinc-ribbon domain-containing protein [Streptomyces acidipaludis]MBY8882451.1 zinc ribbon domain-containing protein [Streptomyces acidipaludis]